MPRRRVVLTRQGCHLCDEAIAGGCVCAETGEAYAVLDVDSPELQRRYTDQVPVRSSTARSTTSGGWIRLGCLSHPFCSRDPRMTGGGGRPRGGAGRRTHRRVPSVRRGDTQWLPFVPRPARGTRSLMSTATPTAARYTDQVPVTLTAHTTFGGSILPQGCPAADSLSPMLFTAATLRGLAEGEVTCTYRRWEVVRPKVGSRFTTAAGVVEVTSITPADEEQLTEQDAADAGFDSGRRPGQVDEREGRR